MVFVYDLLFSVKRCDEISLFTEFDNNLYYSRQLQIEWQPHHSHTTMTNFKSLVLASGKIERGWLVQVTWITL